MLRSGNDDFQRAKSYRRLRRFVVALNFLSFYFLSFIFFSFRLDRSFSLVHFVRPICGMNRFGRRRRRGFLPRSLCELAQPRNLLCKTAQIKINIRTHTDEIIVPLTNLLLKAQSLATEST